MRAPDTRPQSRSRLFRLVQSARRGAVLACSAMLACVIVSAGPGRAADLAPAARAPAPDPAPLRDADAPVFYGTLYLFASALSGTTSTLPPLPATHVDLSFGDILEHFDGALMGAGEMRIGRWSVIGDIMVSQVSPSGTLPGPFASGVEVRSRSLTLQGDVLYRLYDTDTFDVDAGVGLRFWRLGNRLSIEPGALPITLSTAETRNWVDPVLAGRIIAQLGGPWSVTAVGDIGGFGVGSRLTWQAIGTVNYQWTEQLALRLGYRALSVDYEEGAFLYDVRMQGPILGATYRF